MRGSGHRDTVLSVETAQGNCSMLPMALVFGKSEACLGGRIQSQRLPAATDLSGTELRQHDFPSIGAGADGTVWVTWSSYHDRREELNFRRYKDGRWTRLIPVGHASADLWRPHVAADDSGKPWLIWSQQVKGNWDIHAMPWLDNEWGPATQLSTSASPDIEPHVARAADGTVYVVWQALEKGWSHIRLRCLRGGRWSEPVAVTSGRLTFQRSAFAQQSPAESRRTAAVSLWAAVR